MQQLNLKSFDRKSLYIIEKVFALISLCLLRILFCACLRQPISFLATSCIFFKTRFFLQLSNLSIVLLLTLFGLAFLYFRFHALQNLASPLKFFLISELFLRVQVTKLLVQVALVSDFAIKFVKFLLSFLFLVLFK